MPVILEWATCNVCLEIHEQIAFYQFPDGLEFSICLPCLKAAQQSFAPDVCHVCEEEGVKAGNVCPTCGTRR